MSSGGESSVARTGYLLGLDVGTTTAVAVLLEAESRTVVEEISKAHDGLLPDLPPGRHEQSPAALLDGLWACLREMEERHPAQMAAVIAIGLCGQMHGVMLWDEAGWTSSLVTWMDQRGDKDFLTSLPSTNKSNVLHSGYGSVSLAWLHRHGLVPQRPGVHCGSIADYAVTRLLHTHAPVLTQQMAESWGYFERQSLSWNPVLHQIVPQQILPKVVEAGSAAGTLPQAFFGVPAGVPVLAALGDFQANLSAAEKVKAAILNIGTSAQLSYEMPKGFTPPDILDFPKTPIQYFSAFEERYIGIAASLNGGNVLQAFLTTLRSWLGQLAPETELPEDGVLWDRIQKLLEAEAADTERGPSQIQALPLLFGERHDPAGTASLSGLTDGNVGSVAAVLRALTEGLVGNLFRMISPELLSSAGVEEVVLTGLATRPWMEAAVRSVPGLHHFRLSKAAKKLDSAYGSAIIAGIYLAGLKPRIH